MRVGDESVLRDPRVALFLDYVPAASRNRPCHASAVLQMLVGRVDDGVHIFQREIALCDLKCLACR